MSDAENAPWTWDDERDGRFFRITSACFTSSFCDGARVLLASYDADDEVGPMHIVNDHPATVDAGALTQV
jgi:hypothetical protein